MAVSVLIPVYNTLISNLAEELSKQAALLPYPCQILFIDDCSDLSISYLNLKTKLLPNVAYEVLSENIGRAKIRNLLIQKAIYENCIFLDGDVAIASPNFIVNYVESLKNADVVVGGHYYSKNLPVHKELFLHWLYGSKVESKTAAQRQQHPYQSFMTANFACKKKVLETISFNESIVGYGHEDTLLGIELERKQISIEHIDNSVEHLGLEPAKVFLEKQKQAVQNLKKIYQMKNYQKELEQHSRLIKMSKIPLATFFLSPLEKTLIHNLLGKNPTINYLQALKLLWWKKNDRIIGEI